MKHIDTKYNFDIRVVDYYKILRVVCNPPFAERDEEIGQFFEEGYECEWGCPYWNDDEQYCAVHKAIEEDAAKHANMLALEWKFDPIRYIDRKKGIDEKRDAYLCPGCNLHSFVSEQYCPHCGAFMKNGKS